MVKTFREGDVTTSVLRRVSLELDSGATASLVGASGSGKTTLLSLLAGLARPDSGTIVVDGYDLNDLDESDLTRLRANRIGVILQTGNLIPFLSAEENVDLAFGLGRGPRSGRVARDLLGEVGLGHRLDHLPGRLSGGETQRVAVAMALANEPRLLLADEVTATLDPVTAAQVMSVIFAASRQRGLAVLYITHDTELAAQAQLRLRLTDGQVSCS